LVILIFSHPQVICGGLIMADNYFSRRQLRIAAPRLAVPVM
jgi:hypothetical protein